MGDPINQTPLTR